jgi:hypothetical protein
LQKLLGHSANYELGNATYLDNAESGYKERAEQVSENAKELLLRHILVDGTLKTQSRTYGSDDPITLSFIAELTSSIHDESIKDSPRGQLKQLIKARVDELTTFELPNKCIDSKKLLQHTISRRKECTI